MSDGLKTITASPAASPSNGANWMRVKKNKKEKKKIAVVYSLYIRRLMGVDLGDRVRF